MDENAQRILACMREEPKGVFKRTRPQLICEAFASANGNASSPGMNCEVFAHASKRKNLDPR